jgi:periplasmic protein TonB
MRLLASFLVAFTALLHTAHAQKSAPAKTKPRLYEISGEKDATDKAVDAAYSRKFNIIELRDRKGYIKATPTARVVPLPLRSELGQPIHGDVDVVIIVTSDGRVIEPLILKSTDKRLNATALNAIRQWRFAPARLNGSAISTPVVVPVSFVASVPR